MNAQFPAHCEVLKAMTDPSPIEIYHERLTEELNRLADLRFQLAEQIDNRGCKELEKAYEHTVKAYLSIQDAIRSIPSAQ